MCNYYSAVDHMKKRLRYCVISTTIDKHVVEISIEALEKQIPSKVEEGTEGGFDWYCKCGTYLSPTKCEEIKYCISCGQKLDWE